MAVTVTVEDFDRIGHRRVTRLKLIRDSGAAMSVAHKLAETVAYARITKIDGTAVDTRNETPAGFTMTTANGITSILADNTILPVSDKIYVDCFMGGDLGG